MGDMGDMYRDWKEYKRKLRQAYGIDCPGCRSTQPKRTPTIMLPQQRCKVCGYRDPRPVLTKEQIEKVTGWNVEQKEKDGPLLDPNSTGVPPLPPPEGLQWSEFMRGGQTLTEREKT